MIRKCNFSDIDSLVILENENFKSPLSKSFLTQDICLNPISHYICCEIDNKVVGYMGLWLSDIGTVLNLVVDINFRKQGIASLLVKEAIDIFTSNDINQISLEVRVSNFNAINLYKKFNFKEILVKEKYYANKEDAYLMMRDNC